MVRFSLSTGTRLDERCLVELASDGVGQLVEASVPCVRVEATRHLGHDASERVGDLIEMSCSDSVAGSMLVREMVELLLQRLRVVKETDQGVQAVDDSDAMSAELGAIHIVNMNPGEQVLGGRVPLEQVGEDGLRDLYAPTSEGGGPDLLPQGLELMAVLARATVLGHHGPHHHQQNG